MIQLLPWDTDFFGFKTGMAWLGDLAVTDPAMMTKVAHAEGYRLVYIFQPISRNLEDSSIPSHLSFLEKINARLVDTKVVYGGFPTETEPATPAMKEDNFIEGIEEWQPEMGAEKLYELAFQSGEYSRFKLDENFEPGTYKRMYSKWIDNSINGEIAQKILVVRVQNETAGFVTLKIEDQVGRVGLLAVDSSFRGQKIGAKLMQAAMQFTLKEGRRNFRVATQSENKTACAFYEKLGLKVVEAVKVYHWWL